MLSLSMSILAKSSDLGQMKSLDADADHVTLRIGLHGDRARIVLMVKATTSLACCM